MRLLYAWFAFPLDYHGSFFLIMVSIIIGQSIKVFNYVLIFINKIS